MINNKEYKLFDGTLKVLQTFGNAGVDVDMHTTTIDVPFDGKLWNEENSKSIELPKMFTNYINDLLEQVGPNLWEIVNSDQKNQDEIYNAFLSIYPKKRSITIQPSYTVYDEVESRHDFDWSEMTADLVPEILMDILFYRNQQGEGDTETMTFDCVVRHDNFELIDLKVGYRDGRVRKYGGQVEYISHDVFRFLKYQILGIGLYDELTYSPAGMDAKIVCHRDGEGSYVDIISYESEPETGEAIVINDEYYSEKKLNENKKYLVENDNNIFNGYIDIKEPFDSKPDQLNIESIQKNPRFAKLLNTLLYELYEDNLGMNDDNSKYGIVNIYPLNEFTSWSILNYFGGHKFVKQRLLDIFNKTTNEKTPKEFYRWLIENNQKLLKDGPILSELIRTNFRTYNKGSITEKYVIDKLKDLNYDVKYYPPGSKKDRECGIDIEVNGVSYQIKELIGVDENGDKIYLKTPLPKNYLGLEVKRIMLVDINTGDFVSFPNKDYVLDINERAFVLNIVSKDKIKRGNFNKI